MGGGEPLQEKGKGGWSAESSFRKQRTELEGEGGKGDLKQDGTVSKVICDLGRGEVGNHWQKEKRQDFYP